MVAIDVCPHVAFNSASTITFTLYHNEKKFAIDTGKKGEFFYTKQILTVCDEYSKGRIATIGRENYQKNFRFGYFYHFNGRIFVVFFDYSLLNLPRFCVKMVVLP